MKPFFSVIMPVYNREKIVMRAIKSILRQTYQDWELIIVDDASTDSTFQEIKPFLDDNRIIYIKNNLNSGVAISRNVGIRVAKGSYLTFLDSDDEYKEVHLSSRYTQLKNKSIDLLHGGCEIIGNEYVPDKYNLDKLIHIDDCVVGGTFFINNNLPDAFKLFDENVSYSEDSELFERIKKSNLSIIKTDIKTYIYYRDNEDSICNGLKK